MRPFRPEAHGITRVQYRRRSRRRLSGTSLASTSSAVDKAARASGEANVEHEIGSGW
jgi:hypothetical protein